MLLDHTLNKILELMCTVGVDSLILDNLYFAIMVLGVRTDIAYGKAEREKPCCQDVAIPEHGVGACKNMKMLDADQPVMKFEC